MIRDDGVREHLVDTGLINDQVLCSSITNMLSRVRHLDKVPKPIRLIRVNKVEVCGSASEFRVLYNSHYDPANAEESTIDLNGRILKCDYRVYVVLKSLIHLGISKNEEKAATCRDLFTQILTCNPKYIGLQDMFSVLTKSSEYYWKTIAYSVMSCAYTEEEQIRYKILLLSDVKSEEFTSDVIRKFSLQTVEDYNNLLSEVSKKALEDKQYRKEHKHLKSKEELAINYLYYTWGVWDVK
jgi:hypothetical protein